MSTPTDPMSLNADELRAAAGFLVGTSSHLPVEQIVHIAPLESLDIPEPIPDAKGSLTNEQLKALAKKHRPPASWFDKAEEQLF